MSVWKRGEQVPDLHPAQIDLLEIQQRVTAALARIDERLRYAGNARPALRDTLLDLRLELKAEAGTP